MRRALVAGIGVASILMAVSEAAGGVAGSPHDLSISGARETVCAACHTPLTGDPGAGPLWAATAQVGSFTLYDSPTMDARASGTLSGSSVACLGCHDSVVAGGSFGAGGDGDLSNDHPIGFIYDSELARKDGGLRDPSTAPSGLGGTIEEDMLVAGRMECASCHVFHSSRYRPYLRKSNAGSALCLTCHLK